jgi:hypothetical protein
MESLNFLHKSQCIIDVLPEPHTKRTPVVDHFKMSLIPWTNLAFLINSSRLLQFGVAQGMEGTPSLLTTASNIFQITTSLISVGVTMKLWVKRIAFHY